MIFSLTIDKDDITRLVGHVIRKCFRQVDDGIIIDAVSSYAVPGCWINGIAEKVLKGCQKFFNDYDDEEIKKNKHLFDWDNCYSAESPVIHLAAGDWSRDFNKKKLLSSLAGGSYYAQCVSALALANEEGDDVDRALIRATKLPHSTEVRKYALLALENRSGDAVEGAVLEALSDVDNTVRQQAMDIIKNTKMRDWDDSKLVGFASSSIVLAISELDDVAVSILKERGRLDLLKNRIFGEPEMLDE